MRLDTDNTKFSGDSIFEMAADAAPKFYKCCDDETHKPIAAEHVKIFIPIIKKMGAVMIKNGVCLIYNL